MWNYETFTLFDRLISKRKKLSSFLSQNISEELLSAMEISSRLRNFYCISSFDNSDGVKCEYGRATAVIVLVL